VGGRPSRIQGQSPWSEGQSSLKLKTLKHLCEPITESNGEGRERKGRFILQDKTSIKRKFDQILVFVWRLLYLLSSPVRATFSMREWTLVYLYHATFNLSRYILIIIITSHCGSTVNTTIYPKGYAQSKCVSYIVTMRAGDG